MFALEQFAIGLVVAHVAWLWFYIAGTVLWRPAENADGADAILSIVIATGSGMALTGLATFFLGQLGLISPVGFVVLVAILVFSFFIRGDSPFAASFWRVRLAAFAKGLSGPALVVYLVCLADAVPATLPDRMFDALFYYSVLAQEYATSHHQIIDTWLRDPFYANNWVLVETWLWVFHCGDYVGFLTWLTGAMSVLGVFSIVAREIRGSATIVSRSVVIAGGCAAALLLNPMFLWMNSGGMIDVPLGLALFVPVVCFYLCWQQSDPRVLPTFIVTAAFFIGAKISYVAFLPLLFVAAAVTAIRLRFGRRYLVAALGALLLLASPWYVQNLILDGDPIPPILNLAIHGSDPYWSKADAAQVEASISGHVRGPAKLMSLPVDLFLNDDAAFVSDGQTAICLLIMLPLAMLLSGLLFPQFPKDLAAISGCSAYAVAYWLVTSYHVRYALIFYPLLCALVGLVLVRLVAIVPRVSIPVAIIAVALAIPSPGSAAWLGWFWNLNFVAAPDLFTNRDTFLSARIVGYEDALYIASQFRRVGATGATVYGLQVEPVKYVLAEQGIAEMGDWFGPQGYDRLATAIDQGKAVAHLAAMGVGAVVIPGKVTALTPLELRALESQLSSAGFEEDTCPGGDVTAIFIRRRDVAESCSDWFAKHQ